MKKPGLFILALTFMQIAICQTGKYRSTQDYLFQPVPYKYIPNRINGGSPFYYDKFGPTHLFVDNHTAWRWANAGGDWLDSNLVSQGSKPWFSILAGNGVPLYQAASYQGDVTSIINYVYTSGKWNAFLLVPKNAARAIATPFDSINHAPKIIVTYTNNVIDTLKCRIVAGFGASSLLSNTTNEKVSLSAFIEFDKPILPVQSATLHFDVVEHWSGNNAMIEGYLLNPPLNTNPVQYGVAQSAGLLDSNISSQSGVLGAHRYLDNASWSDFSQAGLYSTHLESNFDPAIYGTGPQDLSKLPHLNLGKWISVPNDWSKVASTYMGEGFVPLTPGLGALRIKMDNSNIPDSGVINYGGSFAGDANIYLPDSLNGAPCFGELDHIFIRYYFFIGKPYNLTPADRKQFYYTTLGGQTEWATMAGKWGIVPDHNAYGGYSGSSGGGDGWQMRNSWYECDAGMGGPSEGGWAVGFHLYDFLYKNPVGHNYGKEDASNPIPGGSERWGQKGGMNLLYAGNWYCIETELKLNTIISTTPGYIADGLLRTWIDGKLAYESLGMVFRTQPNVYTPDPYVNIRPIRSLGIRNIKLNWFHGGKTPATIDRTTFYTGLVWSKNYIGPMNLPSTQIGIEEQSSVDLSLIYIYPNPSNGTFQLTINAKNTEPVTINVYDLNARLIYTHIFNPKTGSNTSEIDLSSYAKGLYIVHASTANLSFAKKISIE